MTREDQRKMARLATVKRWDDEFLIPGDPVPNRPRELEDLPWPTIECLRGVVKIFDAQEPGWELEVSPDWWEQ